MDLETAVRCLDEQIDRVLADEGVSWLCVELFGGEPLLQFKLVQELVAWTRSNARGCPIMFMVISNGTLLTEEKKAWFRENKDMIVLCVSYDGSAEAQTVNRGVQVSDALEFCHGEWPDMAFRMTISPDSVEHLADYIRDSARQGYQLRTQLANEVKWTERHRELLEQQLKILKKACLEDEGLLPLVFAPFYEGGEDSELPCAQRCGAGVLKVCYDVDVEKYPCNMFSPLSAGVRALKWGEYQPSDARNHNDAGCELCPIKHGCYTCPAANYIYREHCGIRDHSMCRMKLTLALISIEFQVEKLMQPTLTRQDVAKLKALVRIYDKIHLKLEQNA